VRILVDYRPALRERSGVGEYIHRLAEALVRFRTPRVRRGGTLVMEMLRKSRD